MGGIQAATVLARAGAGAPWLRPNTMRSWPRAFRVAIVGRPNVGKSSLFNRLCGKQMALVYDKPGVTRDAIEGTAYLGGLEFQVTDTAGLDDGGDLQGQSLRVEKVGSIMAASGIGRWPAHLLAKALARTEQVVSTSDLVLFLVDARYVKSASHIFDL